MIIYVWSSDDILCMAYKLHVCYSWQVKYYGWLTGDMWGIVDNIHVMCGMQVTCVGDMFDR